MIALSQTVTSQTATSHTMTVKSLSLKFLLCLGLVFMLGLLAACDDDAETPADTENSALQTPAATQNDLPGPHAETAKAPGISPDLLRPDPDTLVNNDPFLKIQDVTSKSGLTAWLVEDHRLPLLTVYFSFEGAGAAHDPIGKQGLARMVSNTLDEGAADLDSQAFRKLLSDHSISLGFSSSRDNFGGSLYTLTENQDLAFDLLHKALTAPRFDPAPVERMRAANIARIKSSLTDPSWLAARLMNDVAFEGHPYEKNSGGTLTTLQNITPDDLKAFTKKYLTRDRLKIAVVGDIDPETLALQLDKIFGDLPAAGETGEIEDTRIQNAGETVLYQSDIPQTMIRVIQPGIGRNHPDYHAFQVMNFIYGGSGFGSRLMEEVREERGLTYGIYSSLFLLDHAKGISVSTSTANENVAGVLKIIRDEMDKIKTTPVTDDKLQSAQSYLIGSMPLSLTSSRGIASMVLSLQLDDLPIHYLDTVDEKIAAVTAEDIQRIASDILAPDALTTVLVGQPDSITPTRTVETLPNVE